MNEHEKSLTERLIRSNLALAESNNHLASVVAQLAAALADDAAEEFVPRTYMDGTPL